MERTINSKSFFKMAGSPAKIGAIEGTDAHKASIAKLLDPNTDLVEAATAMAAARVSDEIDYTIKPYEVEEEKEKKPKTKKSRTSGIDPTNKTGMVDVMIGGKKVSVPAEDRFKHKSVGSTKKKAKKTT